MLQLLRDFVLIPPTRALPMDPTGGLRPPDPPGYSPQQVKILGVATVPVSINSLN